MRALNWVFRPLTVLVLLLSLASAPVVDALTHGPGTLVAEADHAAWHAEKGELWQADSHQHHDSTDHDNSVFVILTSQETEIFDQRAAVDFDDLPVLSRAIRNGPRRPPRDMV